ncbi:MAG: outer membrane lipoprotein chaperone LolA [Gammaproteobacteria bacterium]|nr:outer membrane lipoprotein chaperone LolA [Pseudomonadota bacterium]TDJ12801.1 MAG: outer membrane lipoprotein chaperone LolA [Gammaproteobacteria bacterium]
MKPYSLFIALSGLMLCSSIFAAEPGMVSEAEGKALVENFVLNIRTLKGRFEQSLVDADNQLVETSSGTLEIQRPGQFRWVYVEPYEQVLVADGLNVWSYDVDLAQVTVKPQLEVLRNTPALLLGGSEDALDQFDYVGSFSDRGTVWIRLRPKDTESGFNKVELGFTDGNLTRMMFSDNLEQTTLIALFDVSLNEDIDAERFQFEPPEGVDIVGTPVKVNESNTDDAAES